MHSTIFSLLTLLLTANCLANTICVDVAGPNNPGTGTPADPFRQIQDAINDANHGDIIEIRPGRYTGIGNYNLDPNGLDITIRSTDPNNPSIVARTVIDPNKAGRAFYFNKAETADCIVSGLTITNGLSTESGGAIYCSNSSSPTITKCVITDNHADFYGGGIFCNSSNFLIVDCTISGNSAIDGAALECWAGSPVIRNTIISNNTTSGKGAAIDCWSDAADVELINCTIVANTADSASAVYCLAAKLQITNSIIWANTAANGYQIELHDFFGQPATASIAYSDIQNGRTSVYVSPLCQLNWNAATILGIDPNFASFDLNGSTDKWDFHLRSTQGRWDPRSYDCDINDDKIINLLDFSYVAGTWNQYDEALAGDFNRDLTVNETDLRIFAEDFLTPGRGGAWIIDTTDSPCLDTGDISSDYSLEPLPNGGRINMGAYGGGTQASKTW